MIGIHVESTEAAYNLALEEHLFTHLSPDHPGWFLLWQNAPSLIVGRHQNTQEEINSALVQRYALPVVRRQTGGGAVYHDLGNLNFSFLLPKHQGGKLDFARFLTPIMETLTFWGLKTEFTSRNDLTLAGLKISGSAQMRNAKGVLHHGTILVSMDLDMLGAVLTGSPDKYISKGISSVRSRVTNLDEHAPADFSMDMLKKKLFANCADSMGQVTEKDCAAARILAQNKYRAWSWNFGASPPFTHRWRQRFSWGALEACYSVRRGIITDCRLYGDYFSQSDVSEIEAKFKGLAYRLEDMQEALKNVDMTIYFNDCDNEEVKHFLCAGL